MARASAPRSRRPGRAAATGERGRPWIGAARGRPGLVLGIFATGAGLGRSANWPGWRPVAATTRRPTPVARAAPVRISIARDRVDAPVIPVGLAGDGSIAVPPLERHDETGWYDRGPAPGETARRSSSGHADTRTRPVGLPRAGHSCAGATGSRSTRERPVRGGLRGRHGRALRQGDLPAERVYGDYSRPGLRLITCGGEWIGGSIGYADNVIAFASLVGRRDP